MPRNTTTQASCRSGVPLERAREGAPSEARPKRAGAAPARQPQRPSLAAIGDAFRAAQAEISAGWPSCPRCFDGQHVKPGYKAPEFHRDVRTYRCRCCHCDFSDLTGTPLERTQAPLVQWAWLLLMPPDDKSIVGRRGGRHSVRNKRLREMRGRIQESPFGQRWKAELERLGVTFEQLAAAQATAPKKLAKRAVGSRPKKVKA